MSDFKVDPTGAMVRRSMGKAPMLRAHGQAHPVNIDGDTSDSNLKVKKKDSVT